MTKSSISCVIDFDASAHVIRVRCFAFRDFEPDRRPNARRLETLLLFDRKTQAGAIVFPAPARPFRRFALFLEQVRRAVALVRGPAGEQLLGGRPMAFESLRLKIRRVRPSDSWTFVPVESQPPHRLEDARHHLVRGSFRVCVFDAKDESAAVPAREEPVEQRCASAADVKISCGRRRESNARAIHPANSISSSGARYCGPSRPCLVSSFAGGAGIGEARSGRVPADGAARRT